MSIWSIIGKEMRHNPTQVAIGLLCIIVASGLVMGSVTLLSVHDLNSERIIDQKERETRAEMLALENDYRLMMRRLGYNVLILHADESLDALRLQGSPTTTLPEQYVFDLSTGGIENLNHFLPILQQRATWEEQGREILLCGIMGQVPNFQKPEFLTAEGRYRNPIREVLPPGAIEVGYDLARSAGISPGDTVTLFGEEFTVHRVHSRTGNDDDVTVWCNLEKVQGWFNLAGRINGILALECVCDFEEFGRVEQEVRGILPDTQVLEFGTILRARFDARARAAAMRESAIDSEIAYRAQLGGQRQRLVRFLVPVVVAGAGVWIFFLIMSNVKERRGEIAVMRTVGVGQRTIMGVFLGKAALMGAAGSVIGCLLGLIGVAAWEGIPVWTGDFGLVLRPGMAALTLVGTLVLAVVAGWIPALKAARLDPATILREE